MTTKLRIVVGYNTLDRDSWVTYDNVPLLQVLRENFGESMPATTRLFHDEVDEDHAIKLHTEEDCHALLDLKGTLYILVYPASPANLFLTSALLLTSVILQAVFPDDKKDPGRPPRTGSPSIALGNRGNRPRPLARIPDYYGDNRITPDLVANPYTIYDSLHRETEILQLCMGRGQYFVNPFSVFQGDSRAINIEGVSVEIYPPGVLPTFGSPDVQIGDPIGLPVQNVYTLEAVNGLRLAPLNERTLHGAVFQRPYQRDSDEGLTGFEYAAMGFVYDGGSVGRILIPTTGAALDITEITDKIQVGDFLECRFDPDGITSVPAGSFDRGDRTMLTDKLNTAFPAAAPNLSDDNLRYEVTSIFPTPVVSGGVAYAEITIAIPAGKLADWAAIPTYMTGPSNVMFCVSVLLTPILKANLNFVNEHGAFFIDDPDMTSIICNFVAERGLFVDDGKNAAAVNPKIAVFVAPADSNGSPTGAFQRFDFTMSGSSTDVSTRALTAVIDAAAGLAITGRALISVIREDFSLWRVEDPGQGVLRFRVAAGGPVVFSRPALIPVGGAYPPSIWNPATTPVTGPYSAIYRARKGTVEDQVRWTHCYSFSDPGVPAFGDTTLVMMKTVASKAANVRKDRKLSMIATRMTANWNGTIWTGPLVANNRAYNAFFHVLKDTALGNVPNAQIDFAGIVAAFDAVGDYFADSGASAFNHCFDSENTSLEDMLAIIAESCFCKAYREGQVIKVKPNLATDSATVLFNHRNMIPDSESRVVSFGTEADYNGARVDYQDTADNTVKSITVPSAAASRVKEVSVGGINNATKALWHAWRALNRINYKNTDTEFEATREAFLATLHDKVLVADQTQAVGVQDGELRGVTGLTVTTTQPVNIASGGPYTVFLQHVDGTVEGIPVASSPNSQQLVLANAPSQTLVVSDQVGVRTKYLLIGASQTKPQAFHLMEKSAGEDGKWSIKASNYSHGYYFVDGLSTWIAPSPLVDSSPYRRTLTLAGGAGTTSDATRGSVYLGGGGADFITITTSSFNVNSVTVYKTHSKSCWVNKTSTGNACDILSMFGGTANAERFGIDAADNMVVFHNGVPVISQPGFPIGGWHLLGTSYNDSLGVLKLYLNGDLLVTVTGLATLTLSRSDLRAFQGLIGMADDLRLYKRALLDSEHRELYHKTRL